MKPRDKQQKNYITWKMQSFFNYLNPKVSHLILNNIYKLVRRLPLSNEKKKRMGRGGVRTVKPKFPFTVSHTKDDIQRYMPGTQ